MKIAGRTDYRQLVTAFALVVAPWLGAPAWAEQDSAKEEETAEKDGAAAKAGHPEYSEEIFVEGTAGTVAVSSGIATKMDLPLLLTPASVSV